MRASVFQDQLLAHAAHEEAMGGRLESRALFPNRQRVKIALEV